jgi:tetratricopeptide (TPR) repeat protein
MDENNENNIEVTKPVKMKKEKKPKKKFFERRFSWFLMGILLCLLILILGMLFGVWGGVNERLELAETQAVPKIDAQLESARLDIEEGRYEVALSRLDWILEEMVEYLSDEQLDEVGELYSQALLNISISTSATLQPTPTPAQPTQTPTPDLRGEEEIYLNAQALIASESWNEAIQMLESLREKNLKYKAVQVDGMFYVALRNRGVQKILEEGSLEPGIYDLTLAEQFAPLDSTAESYRVWARLYLTGASYWGVDWYQVVYYFEQVYQNLPYLMDGSSISATDRFRLGAINYGLELAAAGDYCAAQEYIDKALAIKSDAELQPTAQWVIDECYNEQHPPTKVPSTATPTPTPTQETTEGETVDPTITPTP